MAKTFPCPVCGGPSDSTAERTGDFETITCVNCGTYKISGTAIQTLKLYPDRGLAYLEAARRQAGPGDVPFIRNMP